MFVLLWNLSGALNGYLRFYSPTNRAIDWLRTPQGRKWAIPVALVATPTYLALMALVVEGATHPGFGWLNVLVFVFWWNATKFAVMAVLSPLFIAKLAWGLLRERVMVPTCARGARSYSSRVGPLVGCSS